MSRSSPDPARSSSPFDRPSDRPVAGPVLVLRGTDAGHVLCRLRQLAKGLPSGPEGRGPARLAVAAATPGQRATNLALLLRSGVAPGTRPARERKGVFFDPEPPSRRQVAFVFSGQGSQYPRMLLGALERSPAARARLSALDAALQRLPGAPTDLFGAWRAGRPLPDGDVFSVQALVLAADLVVLATLEEAGIRPDWVTGHSYGDYPALVAAGVWTAEDALEATWVRSRAIRAAGIGGGMIAVDAAPDDLADLLAGAGDACVANVNAPAQAVVSGSPPALARLTEAARQRGLHPRRLPVPGPFHSALMEPAARQLGAWLDRLELRRPQVPFLSSVSGRVEVEPEAIRTTLARQLTSPVDFPRQLAVLAEAGVGALVEVGPRGILTGLAHRSVPELRAVASDHPASTFLESRARVMAALSAYRSD